MQGAAPHCDLHAPHVVRIVFVKWVKVCDARVLFRKGACRNDVQEAGVFACAQPTCTACTISTRLQGAPHTAPHTRGRGPEEAQHLSIPTIPSSTEVQDKDGQRRNRQRKWRSSKRVATEHRAPQARVLQVHVRRRNVQNVFSSNSEMASSGRPSAERDSFTLADIAWKKGSLHFGVDCYDGR